MKVLFLLFFLTIFNSVKSNFISFLECILKNEKTLFFFEILIDKISKNHSVISLVSFLLTSIKDIRNIINICLENQTCKIKVCE
jgi:hypothetical protein